VQKSGGYDSVKTLNITKDRKADELKAQRQTSLKGVFYSG